MLSLLSLAYAAPYAVVIGADRAPPGRASLRYARADAVAVRDVLVELGTVPADRVVVLLDPDPAEVLAAIAAVPADAERLLLYYSGHADERALYPNGRGLPIDDLKRTFEASDVPLRIGVVDGCRGGGWTGAKGLGLAESFPVDQGLGEGTIYVAASTGAEDATEVESLGGSVFTHHWLAGLRGPADADRDGQVSLVESFEWARDHTVRDSTVLAGLAQHPSFHLDLRGREDVVLADLRGARSSVLVSTRGAASVYALDSGAHVADLPGGADPARLVLSPGPYLARRLRDGRVEVAAFEVQAGLAAVVTEEDFGDASLSGPVALKGDAPRADQRMSPEAGHWLAAFRLGSRTLPPTRFYSGVVMIGADVELGLTDRIALTLPTPGVGLRLGESESAEVLIFSGCYGGDYGVPTASFGPFSVTSEFGGGVDARHRLSDAAALDVSLTVSSTGWLVPRNVGVGGGKVSGGIGASLHVSRALTVNPSMGVLVPAKANDETPRGFYRWFQWPTWYLGSSLHRGSYHLPLLQLHATDRVSVDVDFGEAVGLVTMYDTQHIASLGVTWAPPAGR